MVNNLFRTMSMTDVTERIAERWDMSRGFPEPKFTVHCPQCQSEDVLLRHYNFHRRETKAHPYRCDVCVKCTVCSMAFVFGVVVSKEMYAARKERRYDRHEVERILANGE